MVCPHCGTVIPDGSDFCMICGNFMETAGKPDTKQNTETDGSMNDVLHNLFSPDRLAKPVPDQKKQQQQKYLPASMGIAGLVVIALIVGFLAFLTIRSNGRRRGIDGIGEPIQEETTGYIEKDIAGYEVSIYPQYTYEIEALVVHTRRYYGFGLGDRLAPVDVALAWGEVAALNDEIDFNWSQRGRFSYWKVEDYEDMARLGTVEDVTRQNSNNHLIPADSSVRRKVKRIRRGDHIKITGYLVNIDAENDRGRTFLWDSSTTRTDSGDGACEVIYVTDVVWLD